MLITSSEHLKDACQDQIDLFNKTFPAGAKFNKTNWDLALAAGLQVHWMKRFLDSATLKIYEEAVAKYKTIYKEATAPALKMYNEATAPALKIYNEATATALKIYKETIASALKIYEEATATAFFNLLEAQFCGKHYEQCN